MEDAARYLAGRLRARYRLSRSATLLQLLHVCREQGIRVFILPGLKRAGYFVNADPGPAIFLRHPASRRVLAHELYHALVTGNAECGVIYGFPDFADGPEEEAAERFASLLCPA